MLKYAVPFVLFAPLFLHTLPVVLTESAGYKNSLEYYSGHDNCERYFSPNLTRRKKVCVGIIGVYGRGMPSVLVYILIIRSLEVIFMIWALISLYKNV